MRKTRKSKLKGQKQILLVGLFVFVTLMTIGYAAFNTNITLHAKGNIKIKLVDITDNVVTSGDGLYEDEYEDGRYVYKGANPNNYIKFNNELWRIISKEADGTYKIVRNEILENRVWDTDYYETSLTNNWTYATLNRYLNDTYYNRLSNEAQSQIVSHDFGIGGIATMTDDLASDIKNENSKIWNGKVALISVSDFIRTNSNKELCGTNKLELYNSKTCRKTSWLFIDTSTYFWTLTPDTYNNNYKEVWQVHQFFYLYTTYVNVAGSTGGVRPAVFLSSNLSLSGSGTQSDPFIIVWLTDSFEKTSKNKEKRA